MNVKAFLARKREEEHKQKTAERDKTKALLALRQGNKATAKAARKMVATTKSANRAAVDDVAGAKAAEAAAAGRHQCDEDDYGYESTAARNIYDKLMSKYEANYEDP